MKTINLYLHINLNYISVVLRVNLLVMRVNAVWHKYDFPMEIVLIPPTVY